jgi:general L-amino acid transport system permease protein
VRQLWRSERVRSVAAQAVVLAGAIALAAWMLANTLDNLDRRGIASGFGFLGETAGFGIISHLIDYSELSSYGRAFLVGLLNTLLVSALGIVFATVIGFAVGIARLSRNWLVARLAGVYIELLRNVPLLLQIFFWYFAVLSALPQPRRSHALFGAIFLNNRGLYLPMPVVEGSLWPVLTAFGLGITAAVIFAIWARRRGLVCGPAILLPLALALLPPTLAYGLGGAPVVWNVPVLQGFNFQGGMVLIPEFVALTTALTLYTAAFIAETVRAGILAVPRGQIDAAAALGLTRRQAMRFVVIPQALRVIVPPLASHYLSLTKNSSLAAAIGYPELVSVFAGTVLNQTGQAVEIIAITMAVYLAISLAIAAAMNLYNRRVMRGMA